MLTASTAFDECLWITPRLTQVSHRLAVYGSPRRAADKFMAHPYEPQGNRSNRPNRWPAKVYGSFSRSSWLIPQCLRLILESLWLIFDVSTAHPGEPPLPIPSLPISHCAVDDGTGHRPVTGHELITLAGNRNVSRRARANRPATQSESASSEIERSETMSREIDDAEKFENLSQLCEEMTGRPWDGTVAHLHELSTRQQETTEILEVHAEWLSRLRNRALGSGHDLSLIHI